MAAVTGLTMIKQFTYRAETQEEWSNTYHFKLGPPGDAPSWQVLANDVWAQEKNVLPNTVHWVRAYGYSSDDPNADHVWQVDNTIPGPPPSGSMAPPVRPMAGDQAACIWWRLDRNNSKGKPVYLRKYLHAGGIATTLPDELDPGYGTLLGTYAGNMRGIHGGLRSRSHDDNVTTTNVIPYVTTRTLKRRGKRPKTSS